jgi:hypothetical protein
LGVLPFAVLVFVGALGGDAKEISLATGFVLDG